MQGLDHIP